MAELPTCLCARGLPPYDRLTAIYQAAAELSGDTSLPDVRCVAGVSPLSRFSYIYEAFRYLAEDESLPSQICVAGESPQDQVSRIYQAVAIYAPDPSLKSYACVRGMPIWQQWIEIYRALYLAAGSPAGLVNPACVSIASLDVLSDVFCALTEDGGGTAVLIASFDIADPENIASFSREAAAGFTGNGDPFAYQREAAVDVLRSVHYQTIGPLVLLEEIPTLCQLVAPGTPTVDVEGTDYEATYTGIPVTASLLRYEVGLDAPGSWTPNGMNLAYADNGTDGTHTFRVRAVSTSGVPGATATSAPFDLVGATLDPSDYGTPLQWFVADDLAPGAVATWPFRTWGADAVQATGADQPLAVANVMNTHTVVRFDGVSEFLEGTAIVAIGVTMFVVVNLNGSASNYNIISTSDSSEYWKFGTEGYFGVFRATRVNSYPATVPTTGAHLYTIISTASGYEIRIDGVSQGVQAAGFSAGTFFSIGSAAGGITKFFNGDIGEILVMDGEISDPDLSEMEGIIMSQYGI